MSHPLLAHRLSLDKASVFIGMVTEKREGQETLKESVSGSDASTTVGHSEIHLTSLSSVLLSHLLDFKFQKTSPYKDLSALNQQLHPIPILSFYVV